MKKLLLLMTVFSLLVFVACNDDDDDNPQPDPGAPSLTASESTLALDALSTGTITLTLSAEAGVDQFIVESSDSEVAAITVSGAPEVGDTSATVTVSVEAIAIGNATITASVLDAAEQVDEVIVEVSVLAGWDYPFASPYEVLTLRTEFEDMKYVIDLSGQTDAYSDLAEGGIGAEMFFYFGDGWLDEYVENSPFIESREALTAGQASLLAGMFRSQQRDNDASAPYYRNQLSWESLISDTDENVDLGTTANWRNVGIVGNSNFQTLVRPMAYIGAAGSAQIGTYAYDPEFDISTATPTATADELAVNVGVSFTDTIAAAGGAEVPYGIIHAFDGFPADIDAAFADPQGYQTTTQGRLRNYRDVSIIQNLMVVDPDVKWTMNAIEDNTTNYSGSSAMYGVVIVSASVFDDLDGIIRTIDPTYAFGETRTRTNFDDVRSVWFWDRGAGHIPEAVYSAAADYWFKHWIPTETIEDGALADGTFQNFAGGDVTLSGSEISLGGTTVNVLQRVRYQDQRVGRWDRADDGTTLPSQAFIDKTGEQGFKWVEVIIVDGSL